MYIGMERDSPFSFAASEEDDEDDARKLCTIINVKGDLDGTIFSYHCRMRFLERALLASCRNRTQLSPLNIAFTYDCRRILKHVLKSYDIFCDVCDSRTRVAKQFVS